MPFASLGLAPALVQALQACGYTEPTPIQTAAIPPALKGRDVLSRSPTGSGKTAAFALPVLQKLLRSKRPWPRRTQALVLVPTRELAQQVGEALQDLARGLPEMLEVAVVYGGVSINPQMMGLRGGADIVVATPGRLLDLVDHNALQLDQVAMLVLDEADRLLEPGFADELKAVLALLPPKRQTLMLSATFAPAVQALADSLLHRPVLADLSPLLDKPEAAPAPSSTPAPAPAPDILQRAIEVDAPQRTQLLRHLIQTEGWKQVLVFVATRHASDQVSDKLVRLGIPATALHGDMSQGTRSDRLRAFRERQVQVLLATDLAARGIDVVGLPVVVNFDLPRSADDHTHRIGRTGRAGSTGLAVSFVSADTEAHFRLIEKRQGQRVPREQVPGFEPTTVATAEQAVGGVKGKRPSKKDKLRAALARGG